MGFVKGKLKIMKVWKRCQLSIIGANNKSSSSSQIILNSYKNNNNYYYSSKKDGEEMMMAPNGCFSVYVGPEKQRFVVKTKHANHPLFMMLLEEAELEYGFQFDGPILLPCNVDLFFKVLAEMDSTEQQQQQDINNNNNNKVKGYYCTFLVLLLSPKRFLCYHHHGSYKVMDSEMVRVNNFQC